MAPFGGSNAAIIASHTEQMKADDAKEEFLDQLMEITTDSQPVTEPQSPSSSGLSNASLENFGITIGVLVLIVFAAVICRYIHRRHCRKSIQR